MMGDRSLSKGSPAINLKANGEAWTRRLGAVFMNGRDWVPILLGGSTPRVTVRLPAVPLCQKAWATHVRRRIAWPS